MVAKNETQIAITAKDNTAAGFASVESRLSKFSGQFGSLAGPIAVAGTAIAAASAALAASVKSAIDTGDQFNKLSQKTGIAVESLSALAYAGDLADVNLESLATGIKKLSVNMAEAASNTKSKAAEAFGALGVAVKDVNGNLRSSDAVLGDVADKFAGMKDGAGKTALAVALFGKAGADMIPFLNQGSKGLAEMASEAQKFGLVLSGKTAKAAEEFNDNLGRMSAMAKGFGYELAQNVLPWLVRMSDEFIEAKKQGIGFFEGIRQLGTRGTNPQTNIRTIDEELVKLRATIARDTDRDNPTLAKAYAEKIAELQRARAYYVARSSADALAGAARLGDIRDARDLSLASRTDKVEAPALRGSAGLGKQVKAVGSVDDYAMRINQTVASAIGDSAVVKAVELGDAIEKLDSLFFDSGLDIDVYKSAMDKLTGATSKAGAESNRLNELLAATPSEQLEKSRADMQLLATALESKKITEEQFNEAVQTRLGLLAEVKSDGLDTYAALTQAVEGWGNTFTNTLADMVMGGKAGFADLANSIIRDLIRIQIKKNYTDDLVKNGTGFLDKLFSGVNPFGGYGDTAGLAAGVPQYAQGTPYVPNDGLAFLHRGEAVIPADQNRGGVTVNLIEDPNRGGQVQQRNSGGQNVLDVFVTQIRSVVAGDIASGRGPIPAAMESTYGANRAVGAF
ncbi:MAG: hypothetical protein NDI91_17305 [Sulfuritalea sp.]|nr:hypothetical protein [Sulfuritalea sp.]